MSMNFYDFKGIKGLLLVIFIALFYFIRGTSCAYASVKVHNINDNIFVLPDPVQENTVETLRKIGSYIQNLSVLKDSARLRLLADSLIRISQNEPDSSLRAELFYYSGVCELSGGNDSNALKWLSYCKEIKEGLKITDDHYAYAVFDIGVAYFNLGDYLQSISYIRRYIEIETILYGEDSYGVVSAYATLLSAEYEYKDYKSFTDDTFKVLGLIGKNQNLLQGLELGNLYIAIGVGYCRTGNYATAKIYLEKAEKIYINSKVTTGTEYINLLNNLAITYGNLGQSEREIAYFSKGIDLAVTDNSFRAFNMINTFAIGLGKNNEGKRGAALLSSLVDKARSVYGNESRFYYEILRNYAEYLLVYSDDPSKALNLFSTCFRYVELHDEDANLKERVLSGYAEALLLTGKYYDALKLVQELLFPANKNLQEEIFLNPSIDSVQPDRNVLNVLRLKYETLWKLYSDAQDQKILEAAASTSELIISLIEKIRINISDDESRIILGDRYRDSYVNAIRDFQLCFRNTGSRHFLEKAFEYSEKSKVAGLLAATRELNAIQFHIPGTIAELEKSVQREIGLSNSKITLENDKEDPDTAVINKWKERLLSSVKIRDSLARTFERDYPDYYALKYNTSVPDLEEIPSIIGRTNNYLNYIVSDTVLYIFVVNRKNQELLTLDIDSSFLSNLRKYRKLLIDNEPSKNARQKFRDYQELGNYLYMKLFDPVRTYLISDNIVISPDNLLSYLPFETFITEKKERKEIIYRDLNYLMNIFNISYTYSATFMKEIVRRDYKKIHNLVAFAPMYATINTDSLFSKRRQNSGILYDLPFARDEAKYISKITGGKLYLNNDARESTFKKVAGYYDIIHLAMHTYMDDQNPMNSAMIFAQCDDNPEDGILYTHEVYGIPLKARMVVLSSCNTGSGLLSTGEGILSLARGFMYSGSQSVVMSMWEIDDNSGTEVVKMFYDYLKRGKSKSEALRRARSKYLKSANQLKSHPYFWATLVVYGENSPVYFPWKVILIICTLILATVLTGLYFWYRRYS